MPRLSLRGYARHRKCYPSVVEKAIKDGRITRGEDGLIDAAEADRDWKKNTREVRPRAPKVERPREAPDGVGASIRRAHAVKLGFQAQISKLEFEKLSGKLVPLDDVKKEAFDTARRVRNLLVGMGDRIGPVVVGMTVHEAIKLINDEVGRVLDELRRPTLGGREKKDE